MQCAWSHLCPLVLSHVCNMLGPRNIMSVVCKGWRMTKKVYDDIVIEDKCDWENLLDNKVIDVGLVKNLTINKHMILFDHKVLGKFKSLKSIIFSDWCDWENGSDIVKTLRGIEGVWNIDFGGIGGMNLCGLDLRRVRIYKCEGNFFEGVCEMRNLESLYVTKCELLSVDNAKGFGSKHVRELGLWHCVDGFVDSR